MRTKVGISFLLCILLIVCSFSTIVRSATAGRVPDWSDGTFQGVWNKPNDDTYGSLWGILNQGRRETRGTFTGQWNTSDGTENGTFLGVFYGWILIGQWGDFESGKTTRMIGRLRLNETRFSARLFIPGAGVHDITGVHVASFLQKPTGPYAIGIRTMHLIDSLRSENFTEDPTDAREMMIQLWYPIETETEGTRTEYMDYPTFQWLKGRSPIPLITIPNNAYLFVRPHGRNETTVAEGMFPVVVFSPGYDGVYQIYTSFIEDLVSHGFVVASINHPYVSGITVFPDGRTVGLAAVPTDPVARSAFFNMSLRTIIEDAKFVVDTITEMNETDPLFAGRFDLSRVGMYGHSFGGANTATCCYEDARFRAGLTLDGVFYRQFIPGNITVPMLFMFAEARYTNDSTIEYLWNHTINDTFKMCIKGSTHFGFTDVGVLLSHLVPLIPPRLLLFGSIPPKRMVNITRTYVTVFFDVYLNGAPVERLLDLSEKFDEVIFHYKLG
jgi:dienelactone hydrolase